MVKVYLSISWHSKKRKTSVKKSLSQDSKAGSPEYKTEIQTLH